MMTTIREILQRSSRILAESGIDDAPRQAASLLAVALKRDRAFLIAHPEYELNSGEQARFEEYLRRRAAREPLQYIRGTQEFYRLEFDVAPGVLIPRPETEILVENAIDLLKDEAGPWLCEVGVGTGCISISILHEVRQAFAAGLDISDTALGLTRKNALKHDVSERLKLARSDVFGALAREKFELIVSNPPYIPKAEYDRLQPEVRDFEPAAALTDGGTGLSIIGKIAIEAPKYLKPGGFLLMEIGFGQAEKVEQVFASGVWQSFEILPDLQSIPRIVKARGV
jgi:release factor glutamine methyltransferase